MAEVSVIAQAPTQVEVLPAADPAIVEVTTTSPPVVEVATEGPQGPAGLTPESGDGISVSGTHINLDISSLPLAPPN